MQILCGLQVVFFLFNCQTPGKEKSFLMSPPLHFSGRTLALPAEISYNIQAGMKT